MTDLVDLPLRHFRYRMTRADFWAFEALQADGLWGLVLAVVTVAAIAGWRFELIEPHLPFEVGGAAQQSLAGGIVAGVGFIIAKLGGLMRRRWRSACHSLPAGEQVGRVIATPEHVFIFTAPNQALIMPLRVFESAAEMMAFADGVEDDIEALVEMLSAESCAK